MGRVGKGIPILVARVSRVEVSRAEKRDRWHTLLADATDTTALRAAILTRDSIFEDLVFQLEIQELLTRERKVGDREHRGFVAEKRVFILKIGRRPKSTRGVKAQWL